MPLNREAAHIFIEGDPPDTFLERFEMTERAAERARAHLAKRQETRGQTLQGDVKHAIYGLLHPFGVHEWAKLLIYDPETDRIIDPGAGRVVCRRCRA